MKYLDENIDVTVTGFTSPADSNYQYNIQRLDGATYTNLFIGTCWLSSGTTSKTFHINDVLETERGDYEEAFDTTYQTHSTAVLGYEHYRVVLVIGNGQYSATEDVFLGYRYPDRKTYLEHDFKYRGDMREGGSLVAAYNLLQGYGNFLPRIPYKKSSKFPFMETLQFNAQVNPHKYFYQFEGCVSGSDYDIQTLANNPITLEKNSLSSIFNGSSILTGGDTAKITFNLQEYSAETVTSTLNMTDGVTEFDYDGEVAPIGESKTNYYIGRASDYIDVYAGANQVLLGTFSIDGTGDKVIDIPKAIFTGTSEYLFTLQFYYLDSVGRRIHEGYLLIENGSWFSGVKENLRITFTKRLNEGVTYSILDLAIKTMRLTGRHKLFDAAEIDICPKDYYLIWRDRYGSFQSQPFEKIATFSENVTYTTIRNYKNEARHSSVQVQPKWKLNSDWIEDKYLPFYDSIYSSPYILLYDAKQDVIYNVNVSDTTYTEKTYKNQGRKMFNMEINLELNKQQINVF